VPRDEDDIDDGGDNPYAYTVTYGFENGAVGNLLMSRLRCVYRSDGYEVVMWDHGHLRQEDGQAVAYYYQPVPVQTSFGTRYRCQNHAIRPMKSIAPSSMRSKAAMKVACAIPLPAA